MSHLLFSPDGSLLLHCFIPKSRYWLVRGFEHLRPNETLMVEGWDVASGKFRFRVPGFPIGISSDNATFLTHHHSDNTFSAWNVADGAALDFAEIDPTTYALNQRVFIDKPNADEKKLTPPLSDPARSHWNLIRDVFDVHPPQWFEISDILSNFVLETYAFYACYFDFGDGMEGAYGHALGLDSGKIVVKFDVNRHTAVVPLYCSTPHQLLFVGGWYSDFEAIDLQTGKKSETETATSICKLLHHHRKIAEGAAFHPDGERLVLSLDDKTLAFWQISASKQFTILKPPRS